MAAFLNVCRFNPSAGGTADWTYSSAVTGYQSPAAAGVVNGRLYKYRAESADLSQWEVGEGAYNSSTDVLARSAVLFNSLGTTAKINFSTTPLVAVVALKEDLISVEESNNFTGTQKARARANIDVLKKNYVINGGMMVSQEWGATAGNTAPNYYAADQFFINFAGTSGAYTIAQVASVTPGGSPNRIRTTVTAADAAVAAGDLVYLATRLEGFRVADLVYGAAGAKTTTIQFGVKAPAGTYCVTFVNGSASRCYVAEYVISGGEANIDVVKSVTIPGDITGTWAKDNTCGLEIRWGLMCGSTFQFTANVWGPANGYASPSQFNFMGTNGNLFELFDVGLYEGAAPSFQLPDYDEELRKCQRHFIQTLANEYLPVSGTLVSGATTGRFSSMPVPVAMRTDPTVTLGTGAAMQSGGATAALTAITATATPHATLMLSFTWTGLAGSAISDALVVLGGSTPTKFNARL